MLERVVVVGAVMAVAGAGTTPAVAATPRSPEACLADPGYDHCVLYTPADGVDANFLVPEGVSSVHAMAWGPAVVVPCRPRWSIPLASGAGVAAMPRVTFR